MTACMMILWWRFLVRLADDRSDGMDSMHGELASQVKFNRTPVRSFTYDITWRK